MAQRAKALVTRLLAEARFELRELAFALVVWHPADVMLARTSHEVEGAEHAATVVQDADRGWHASSPYGGRRRVNHGGSPRERRAATA